MVTENEAIQAIEADNEKEFLKALKKKQKGFLVQGLSIIERERIAEWICSKLDDVMGKHKELEDDIDEYDEVYRMERKEVPGSDGDMPNYRSPTTTVAMEVVHANIMNVFFTPKDIGNALPTEEGDVPKISKLSTFMNWSAKNELDMFTQCDRMFHNSSKTGECPYMVHWVKEYGTDIVRKPIMNPANPTEPLVDPDTLEPIFQEVEEQKLLYNAPKLEVFSRKDYFQPKNALMDKTPEWEARRIRMTFDQYLREELQGKMYPDSIDDIADWGGEDSDTSKEDYEGDAIPTGRLEEQFFEFYGRMRITVIKSNDDGEISEVLETKELEDEFIALVHKKSRTLCSLRKNKFPLKMRPLGVDYFMPDDEGRRKGIGMVEFMESIQKSYDALFNQYIWGVVQSNNPFGFYTPTGNQRNEPLRIKNGYLFPTTDPNSINIVKLPPPDNSIANALELVTQWSQLLFGISDFTSGVQSRIDPDSPAKKAEIVVQQGNVRMNAIIKRKNKTVKDILKRWYLLYKDNMPPNKYMRIVGNSANNPFEFKSVTLEDFALNSLPDFELTGNVLNSNKTLEANKKIAIYNLLAQNPFFNPQTQQGLQSLAKLTKWLIDGLDEMGLSSFVPDPPGENVQTPEEENARFMQGDIGEPTEGEDHVNHAKIHNILIMDPVVPDNVKQELAKHIQKHIELQKNEITQQLVMQQSGLQPQQGGVSGNNVTARPTGGEAQGIPQGQPTGMV